MDQRIHHHTYIGGVVMRNKMQASVLQAVTTTESNARLKNPEGLAWSCIRPMIHHSVVHWKAHLATTLIWEYRSAGGAEADWQMVPVAANQQGKRIADMAWSRSCATQLAFTCEDGSLHLLDSQWRQPGRHLSIYASLQACLHGMLTLLQQCHSCGWPANDENLESLLLAQSAAINVFRP